MMTRIIAVCLLAISFQLTLQSQSGTIIGRVYDAVSNEPLPFANILLTGTTDGTTSDINGIYKIENLSPGLYSLGVKYIGYKEQQFSEIQVTNNKAAIVDFALEQSSGRLNEVVVKANPFSQKMETPLSIQSLSRSEIERNPGANRDISKVIQSLPGVSSTVSFRNDIIIRGGAPSENVFYLENIELPVINHFATQGSSGGPVGIINADLLNKAELYTGSFPANRGNTLSAALEMFLRTPAADKIGGSFSVGASDAGLTMEGPLNNKLKFQLSVRQSYLQFLFQALELPFLPTYTDALVSLQYKPDKKNEFRFLALGAYDQFRLNLDANETEAQQYLLNVLPITPQWNYTNGLVYKNFRKNAYTTVVASRSYLNNRSYKYMENEELPENLISDYTSTEASNKLRIENTSRNAGFKIQAGLAYSFDRYTNSTFNIITTPGGPDTIDFYSKLLYSTWGLFGQLSKAFFNEKLTASAGVRFDGNSYSSKMRNPLRQFSPRLSLSYAASPQFSINFNTGIYYQLPSNTLLGYRNAQNNLVNRETMKYIRSVHLVGGLAYVLPSETKISVEGFYKSYSQYPFLLRDSINLANLGGDFGVIGNEPALSNSGGNTYGLEVFVQQKLFKGFYGMLAYTWMKSQFEDKNQNLVASSWDNRHTLTLTAGKKFTGNWEIGTRFRYGSGTPYTPFNVALSSLKQNWDINGKALPDYDLLNTERLPAYYNLDVRVDKKFYSRTFSLNLYVDIQNITNFKTRSQDLLLPVQDENGNITTNPENPSSYLLKRTRNEAGSLIPTLGIILEW